MNKKNSMKAFSIVEAIVSMAIMAIILGIVFFIFSIVTERMLDYKNQNQLVNDLNRLTYSINKDIFDNEKINMIDNEIIFDGYSGERIKYNLTEEYILRHKETFIDTFKVLVKQTHFDSIKSDNQKKVFLKLKLKIEVNKREMDIHFYKQVFADELLKKIKK